MARGHGHLCEALDSKFKEMLLGPSRVGGAGSLLLLRLTQQGEAADPGGVHRSGRESPANEAAQGSSDKGPTGN